MRSKRTLAITSLCISMSAASFPVTRLSIQHHESGKQRQTQSVMIASGIVRMEQGAMDDTVLLYHRQTSTFYAIQPSQKSYLELDPVKAGEMMDQANQMQQQMMAQLQERMKDMPEEQRVQMMKRSGQSMPGLSEEPVRYETRGGSDSVGGFSCNWVEPTRVSAKCESCAQPIRARWGCPRVTRTR